MAELPAVYTVYYLDAYGNRIASLGEAVELDVAIGLNIFGVAIIKLQAEHLTVDWSILRQRDGRLAIYRQAVPGGLVRLLGNTTWLIRDPGIKLFEKGVREVSLRAFSGAALLLRRHVLYAAGSAQAKKTDLADDMMKEILEENFGATAGGSRDWSALLSIEADTGAGPSVTMGFSRRNVLKILQGIAQKAAKEGTSIYFDIVAPTEGTLEFRTYAELRGADKTLAGPNGVDQAVKLSVENKTITDGSLFYAYSKEVSHVTAAGKNQGAARETATAEDLDLQAESPFGLIEDVKQAGNVASPQLQAEADKALRQGRPVKVIKLGVSSVAGIVAGEDYVRGDRVDFEFEGELGTAIVSGMRFQVRDKNERVTTRLLVED